MPEPDNQESSSEALQGLSSASQTAPASEQSCTRKPRHWVGLRLRYKDDKSEVEAADCLHLSGDTVNGGPLAAGELETHDLEDGSYQASFPEIDASEWEIE